MMKMLRRRWDAIWFRPASRASFVATRVFVAAYSIWILASNPDLPSVVGWPVSFWRPIHRTILLRFGYFGLHSGVEWILFVLLGLLLVAVMFGVTIRVTAFAAGMLLYHFAPLDSLLASGDFITMGGLTVPTVMMFAIWAADRGNNAESSDYRWPVVLGQLLLAMSFLLGGITKLRYVGWNWYTGANVSQLALATWSFSGRQAALWIATHVSAAWIVALGSAVLDWLFVPAVLSRRARWVVLPLALIALAVRSVAFGVHWLAAPLLLLFADWDSVSNYWRGRRNGLTARASSERRPPPRADSTST